MSIMIFVMTKIIMMTGMPFKFYSLLCFCNYHLTLFRPFCQSPNNLGKDGTDNPTSEIVDWFWLEIVNRIWLGLKIAAGSDILSCNTAITSIWQSEIVLLTQHGLHVLQIQKDKYTNTSGVCTTNNLTYEIALVRVFRCLGGITSFAQYKCIQIQIQECISWHMNISDCT